MQRNRRENGGYTTMICRDGGPLCGPIGVGNVCRLPAANRPNLRGHGFDRFVHGLGNLEAEPSVEPDRAGILGGDFEVNV